MNDLHKYPMVRLLLPFLAGIIASFSIDIQPFHSLWVPICLFVLLFLAVFIFPNYFIFSNRWLIGLGTFIFLFVTAYNYTMLCRQDRWERHFSKQPNSKFWIAEVSEIVQEKEYSFKTVLTVRGIVTQTGQTNALGRVITYFDKDSLLKAPVLGSLICIQTKPTSVEAPRNPGMFNYKRYLANNNIYHQVYLQHGDWHILQEPSGFSLKKVASDLRDFFLNILRQNGVSGTEYAVASALLLGYSYDLDSETLRSYSGAGAVHILSVSGLHVGVVCFLLSFLLKFLDKHRKTRILKVIILISFIWFYALLTGLSPSVMRAAAMFSCISFGELAKRKTELINTLAISAFILLALDPLLLLNIGFQLSYLAIIGIAFIYKILYKWWKAPNRALDWVWQLVAVSLAAQIATGPLSIYYFHQFPLYFLLTNIIAVPLSSVIIYVGVALLLLSFVPVLSHWLGWLISWMIKAMNFSIKFIETLPGSAIQNISWTAAEMLLIYFLLACLVGWIISKHKFALYAVLASLLCISVCFSFRKIRHENQEKIIFYSINKHSAMELVLGENSLFIADSLLLSDSKTMDYQSGGEKIFLQLKNRTTYDMDALANGLSIADPDFPIFCKHTFYQFGNTRIAIPKKIATKKSIANRLKVDYLLITKSLPINPNEIMQLFEPKTILIDASNSVWRGKKWQEAFEKLGIPCKNLRSDGALVCDLKNNL